jgi:hypothetical protein
MGTVWGYEEANCIMVTWREPEPLALALTCPTGPSCRRE